MAGPVCDGAGGNVARGRTFYRQAWRLGHDQDAARLGGDRARRRRPPEQRRLHPGRVASAPDDQARADERRSAGAEAELSPRPPAARRGRYTASAMAGAFSVMTRPSALSTTCGTYHSLFAGITPQRLLTPATHSGL